MTNKTKRLYNPARKAFKNRVFNRVKNVVCYICGKPLKIESASVDHFMPLHAGGDDELSNFDNQ